MITRIFSAPTGSGLRKLEVAPAALALNRRIIVVVACRELAEQFKQWLPHADYCLASEYLTRANDHARDLVIVDQIGQPRLSRIRTRLDQTDAEVWLINPPAEYRPVTTLTELKAKATQIHQATRELNWMLDEARRMKGMRVELELLDITECGHSCAQHLLAVDLMVDLGLVTE